jgi:hypothetical protein
LRIRRRAIPRKPRRRKIRLALRIQYDALPYRFTPDAALEILLVTTRRSKRWIIPKGWPIKGLRPPKSAAREALEAGIRGKIGAKSVGLFKYNKLLDGQGIEVSCEVKVFPLLVKRQSKSWPELEQRLVQWVEPAKAVSLIKERQLKKLVGGVRKAGHRRCEEIESKKAIMKTWRNVQRDSNLRSISEFRARPVRRVLRNVVAGVRDQTDVDAGERSMIESQLSVEPVEADIGSIEVLPVHQSAIIGDAVSGADDDGRPLELCGVGVLHPRRDRSGDGRLLGGGQGPPGGGRGLGGGAGRTPCEGQDEGHGGRD